MIVGPGPATRATATTRRWRNLRAAVAELMAAERPFLAVCLGHQALCHHLGIPLTYKDIVFQGTQSPVSIDGRTERVGFYNTFVGRAAEAPAGGRDRGGVQTGDIHVVRGPHYRGIQFHAESILTEHGYDLLHEIVVDLLLEGDTSGG